MKILALVAMLSITAPSSASIERLVSQYLSARHPVVTLRFGVSTSDQGLAALARAGLARIVSTEQTCFGLHATYAPSKVLIDMAKRKRWAISRDATGGLKITVPVGTYAYVEDSLHILDSAPDLKWIDFNYRLVLNANAKTLSFFAPASKWILDENVSLSAAHEPQSTSLSIEHSANKWHLNAAVQQRPTMLCPDNGPANAP